MRSVNAASNAAVGLEADGLGYLYHVTVFTAYLGADETGEHALARVLLRLSRSPLFGK
jgi:hypothetical protein